MTCTEEYKEHIEYTFHAFCKIVIRNASYTAIRTWSTREKYPLTTSQMKSTIHSARQTNISKHRRSMGNIRLPFAAIRLSSMMICLPPPSPVCPFWNGKWSTCPFSSGFHSMKSADGTGIAEALRATISERR